MELIAITIAGAAALLFTMATEHFFKLEPRHLPQRELNTRRKPR